MTGRECESEAGDVPPKVWGRVVGIDPGLNVTGYGVVDPGPRGAIVVEAGVIRPGSSDRALGQRLIERLPVVVAPIVSFGGQWIQAETFRQILCEVVDAFRAQGVTRVVLLEAGLSTERRLEGPSGVLVLRVQDVPGGLIDRLRSGSTVEHETSMVLALAPRSVRPAASAGVGDPSHATAFKGERLLAAWSDALAAMLTAEWPQLDA